MALVPPYASVQASINGAGNVSGYQSAPFGATLQLSAVSTQGWQSARWEIYDYPIGFTLPSGWSQDPSGVYYYAPSNPTALPPLITLPASGPNNWGPFMIRLRVNGNPLARQPNGAPNSAFVPQLTDESTVVYLPSPNLNMQGLGFNLTTQADALRGFVGPLMQSLRAVDTSARGTLYGTYASRPAAGYVGRRYVCSDGTIEFVDDGTQWRPLIEGVPGWEVAPGNSIAAFTRTLGAAGGTVVAEGGIVNIFMPDAASHHAVVGYDVPVSVDCTLTACIRPQSSPLTGGDTIVGIYALDTISGQFITWGLGETGAFADFLELQTSTYANTTTVSATPYSNRIQSPRDKIWLRIGRSGAQVIMSFGADGPNGTFVALRTSTLNNAASRLGFYADPYKGDAAMSVLSWKVQ